MSEDRILSLNAEVVAARPGQWAASSQAGGAWLLGCDGEAPRSIFHWPLRITIIIAQVVDLSSVAI